MAREPKGTALNKAILDHLERWPGLANTVTSYQHVLKADGVEILTLNMRITDSHDYEIKPDADGQPLVSVEVNADLTDEEKQFLTRLIYENKIQIVRHH